MTEKLKFHQLNSDSTEQFKKEVQEKDTSEIRKIAVEMLQKTNIF